MRSRHADAFNHDRWAEDYDAKVQDGTNPIRTGYAALLAWTLESSRLSPDSVVLDLGAGTGNTVASILAAASPGASPRSAPPAPADPPARWSRGNFEAPPPGRRSQTRSPGLAPLG